MSQIQVLEPMCRGGKWTKGEIDKISLGHKRQNFEELEKKTMCNITKNRFSDIERDGGYLKCDKISR
jgi:transcriptional regulator